METSEKGPAEIDRLDEGLIFVPSVTCCALDRGKTVMNIAVMTVARQRRLKTKVVFSDDTVGITSS